MFAVIYKCDGGAAMRKRTATAVDAPEGESGSNCPLAHSRGAWQSGKID